LVTFGSASLISGGFEMNGLIPPGYRAVLIGTAATIKDLGIFTPLEEGVAEGALMLARLDFADFPPSDVLTELEEKLQNAGVPAWPGYSYIVYADTTQPSVFLAWQKGIAWMPIIIGLLVTIALPPLLGSLMWLILPQSLKDLITGMIGMGMMVLVIWLMSKMMPALMPAKEKPKAIKEAKPAEEAKT
jgi:hypothetical protein